MCDPVISQTMPSRLPGAGTELPAPKCLDHPVRHPLSSFLLMLLPAGILELPFAGGVGALPTLLSS